MVLLKIWPKWALHSSRQTAMTMLPVPNMMILSMGMAEMTQ